MSAADHKRLIQRTFEEAVSNGKMAVLDEAFSATGTFRTRDAAHPHSPELITRGLLTSRELIPDLKAEIMYIVAENDLVATVTRWSGTSQHTGTPGSDIVFHLFRFADGKVVEEWADGFDWVAQVEAEAAAPVLYTTRTWVFQPGRADEGRAALGALDRAADNVPGAVVRLFQDRDRPERFVTFGAWPNPEAFDAFATHPDTARAGDAIGMVLETMHPDDASIFMAEIEHTVAPR